MANVEIKALKLTAEEKKVLKANKSHLVSAYKSDYTLPLYQKDLIALNDMYMKYFNKQGINISCPKCVLKLLKTMYVVAEANTLL